MRGQEKEIKNILKKEPKWSEKGTTVIYHYRKRTDEQTNTTIQTHCSCHCHCHHHHHHQTGHTGTAQGALTMSTAGKISIGTSCVIGRETPVARTIAIVMERYRVSCRLINRNVMSVEVAADFNARPGRMNAHRSLSA